MLSIQIKSFLYKLDYFLSWKWHIQKERVSCKETSVVQNNCLCWLSADATRIRSSLDWQAKDWLSLCTVYVCYS